MSSKKQKAKPPTTEPREGGLKHNPFAALGGARPVSSDALPPPPAAPAAEAARPEAALKGKITVRRETGGRGGKTVTRVLGLPTERLEELASRMKKALGCGAVVEGGDLVLLGSLVPRAAAWLRGEGASRVVEAN